MALYAGALALTVDHDFRLLVLSAGKSSDDLRGELIKASTDDVGIHYTALSYTWGDPSSPGFIILNDCHILPISRNLEAALRQLRLPTDPLSLWVDAICINQADAEEKESQVGMMRDIYLSARQTWVWLGPSSADSDEAMDTVQGFHKPGLSAGKLRLPSREAWDGIANLIRRSWWKRVWVIQEVLSSTHIRVCCGRKKVDFECFVTLEQKRRESSFPYNPRQPFAFIMLNWSSTQESVRRGGAPLFEWIFHTQYFESTLRRDKIYALLGLCNEESRKVILPDYSRLTSDALLLTQATAHTLIQQKRLLPLQFGYYKKVDGLDLPSWAFNWVMSQQDCIPLVFASSFCACGQYTSTTPRFSPDVESPSSLPEDASLILQGVVEGEIGTAHPMPEVPVYSGTDAGADLMSRMLRHQITRSTCRDWKQEFDRLNLNDNASAVTDSHHTAFWRTIIADGLYDNTGPPGPEYGRRFEEWQAGIESDGATKFRTAAVSTCGGRSFIRCRDGRPGLAPRSARAGDVVCLFHGGDVPFILRPLDSGRYTFVGEAYIHGIMQGEHSFKLGGADLQEFEIR
ncbi:MAG: hypothetical protein Q9208_007390 [Pyrenodesmia sp. 3 TL-2023]